MSKRVTVCCYMSETKGVDVVPSADGAYVLWQDLPIVIRILLSAWWRLDAWRVIRRGV